QMSASVSVSANSQLSVPTFDLVHWLNAVSHTAKDPRIEGDVDVENTTTTFAVEFDTDGDGQSDGVVNVGGSRHFAFTPTGLVGTNASVRARLVSRSDDLPFAVYGSWSSALEWTIVPNEAPTVLQVGLKIDSGNGPTDHVTSVSTLTGSVGDDLS